jgi:hypothetical protein
MDFAADASLVYMVLTWHWTGIGAKLTEAIPNLDYGFRIERVDGNSVRFSTQNCGTHTRDLDLGRLSIGTIPATNKSISAGREYGIMVVRGGQVISWGMESVHCTTLNTILEQLGIRGRWQLGY